MISTVQGIVQRIGESELIVDIGGVGLRIAVPIPVIEGIERVGETIFLHTYLVVREDSLSLYGFHSERELEIFEELIEVSGVGPRLALATLSYLKPETLQEAVGKNQPEIIARVPGIGQKTAAKIVLHLKDRFEPLDLVQPVELGADSEVLEVLIALGYRLNEAQSAVRSIPQDSPQDVEERVRLALKYFG